MPASTTPPRRASQGRPGSRKPSLRVERALQREGHRVLAGMDEVGRGALAGPVSVGVVLIDESCRSAPAGVRDSKLLTPAARRSMVPRIERWALAYAVGHASPGEIDEVGIIAALRLAGLRALSAVPLRPDLVILDGNHDWLTAPQEVGLFAFAGEAPVTPPVTTMIKADMKCSSVAAASVLAKVERDTMMIALADDHDGYGWHDNKGYAAPEHIEALTRLGSCEQHRRSWRLPGIGDSPWVGDYGPFEGVVDVGDDGFVDDARAEARDIAAVRVGEALSEKVLGDEVSAHGVLGDEVSADPDWDEKSAEGEWTEELADLALDWQKDAR